MSLSLLLVGTVKLVVGILLGAFGVAISHWGGARLLKGGPPLVDNLAAGVLHASALLALAILARNSLWAGYDTIDLVVHAGSVDLGALLKVAAHGLLHVGLA